MNEDEWSFVVPFPESDSFRFRTSLEQVLSMGGKINMGYDEGAFSIPIPTLEGEIEGSYVIGEGWLRIKIDRAPDGISVEMVKDLYLEYLGLKEEDMIFT
jgi:hypothetical protein